MQITTILTATLLALALTGCVVDTRPCSRAVRSAIHLDRNTQGRQSPQEAGSSACMRAAGYQVAEECMRFLSGAVTASAGCFVPVGTVSRWVFNVGDDVLRPPPPAEIKCELESCPLLDDLRTKGLVGTR